MHRAIERSRSFAFGFIYFLLIVGMMMFPILMDAVLPTVRFQRLLKFFDGNMGLHFNGRFGFF
ncbi:hypothetical protein [Altibacter sp.]|uniref:Uncharacterized protein n=1 Tax=Euzebyella saccharophila TaxID=679664 RepID=A0ABV8JL55_9FLAO